MRSELDKLKDRLYGEAPVGNLKFFPGSSRDAGPEDWARELNDSFITAETDGLKSINIEAEIDD